ncbi:MAG TPA: filamentous hemagglutinin N-terminal domain-containing protein, partial [Burkholderiaceae bacterium]|nr:filamentous hemagglutinin N-terminal domain-containing protein [Burkholderiaceae bacterium]
MTRKAPRLPLMQPPVPRYAPPAASPAGQGFQPRLLAWAMAAAFMALHQPATAQPAGAQVVAGQAHIQQQGNNLLVTTQNAPGKQHSTINWQSFNVPAGSTTYFQQPGPSSTSINRVTAPNPSAIMGNLGSNGHLVLVNPAGIAVGAGAVVDTARFTAAAMQMTDADAIAGRLRFEGGAAVEALGRVLARTGDVVLLAPNVTVQPGALIQAPNGTVMLAAGQKVELVSPGMEGLRFEVQAPADQALNLGTLQGNAVGMFAGSLRHSGQIDVMAVQDEGGRVRLVAKDSATIDGQATARRLERLGGLFHATGQTVTVEGNTRIDASGAAGGGEILIGGGWQGQDTRLANAQTTTVTRGAVLDASATDNGRGGTVVAWADGHTRFQGQVRARGGEQGGDGGRVETSGKQTLDARGARVDTRAPLGRTGDWLLDPAIMTIVGGSAPPPPASPSSVYETDLESATANVTVSATDSIQVLGTFGGNAVTLPSNISLTLETTGTSGGGTSIDLMTSGQPISFNTSGSANLTISAASGNIKVNDSTTLSSTLAGGSGGVNITASNGGIDIQRTTVTSAGAVTVSGGSTNPATGIGVRLVEASLTGTGAVSITGKSNANRGVSVGGTNTFNGSSVTIDGTFQPLSAGSSYGVDLQGATLNGTGNLTITGNSSDGSGVRLDSASVIRSTGNITVNAPTGGTYVSASSIQATAGTLSISGTATSNHGVHLANANTLSGSSVTVTGTSSSTSSDGVFVGGGTTNSLTGTGSLTITGTQSSTTKHGVHVNQASVSRSDAITISGTASTSSDPGVVIASSGSISGSVSAGSAALSITGSSGSGAGVKLASPAPAPAASVSGGAVTIQGTTNTGTAGVLLTRGQVSGSGTVLIDASTGKELNLDSGSSITKTNTGDVSLVADRIVLDGTVTASASGARVILRPLTSSRAVHLGVADTSTELGISDAEIDRITTPTIVVGQGTHTGGIVVGGAVSPANATSLSLISNAAITQPNATNTITVNNLNVDGASVTLNTVGGAHTVSRLSGHSRSGNFNFRSTGALEIGTVDGQQGIDAHSGNVTLNAGGAITQTQLVKNTQQWSSTSDGGLTLSQTGNQISEVLSADNRSSGNISLTTEGATTYTQVTNAGGGNVILQTGSGLADLVSVNSGTGRIQATSGGAARVGNVQSTSTTTGDTASLASVAVTAAGNITQAAAPAPGIQTGGSVFLQSTASGAIGTTTDPIKINTSTTTGLITIDAAGAVAMSSTQAGTTRVGGITSPGNITLTGPGGTSTLDIRGSVTSTGGNLSTSDFATTRLGDDAADVFAANAITISGSGTSSSELHGTLRPGRSGNIGTATFNNNVTFKSGSILEFDLNSSSTDTVTVAAPASATFESGVTLRTNVVSTQPGAGNYTLVSGTTTGTVPTLTTGNLTGPTGSPAPTLAFGSIILTVSAAPPPPPPPP